MVSACAITGQLNELDGTSSQGITTKLHGDTDDDCNHTFSFHLLDVQGVEETGDD